MKFKDIFQNTNAVLAKQVQIEKGTDSIDAVKGDLLKCQTIDEVLKSEVFTRALALCVKNYCQKLKNSGDNRIVDVFDNKDYREKHILPKVFSQSEEVWNARSENKYEGVNNNTDIAAIVFLKESLSLSHQDSKSNVDDFATKILKLADVNIDQQGSNGIFKNDYKRISSVVLKNIENIEKSRTEYWKKKREKTEAEVN